MKDFESTLGTALRERVADVHPDLTGLVDGSIRTGVRLRRRRRAGLAAAGVAAVAGVAVGGALLADGSPARTSDRGLASEPTTTAPSSAATRPTDTGPLEDYFTALDLSYGVNGDKRSVQVPSSVTAAQRERISALLPLGWKAEYYDENAPAAGLVSDVPVRVPREWTCSWYLADDKASCTAAGGRNAGLVIRPKSDHAGWSSSPDKGGAGSGAYVTAVHDGIFISVQGGRGSSDADLRELRDGLVWKD